MYWKQLDPMGLGKGLTEVPVRLKPFTLLLWTLKPEGVGTHTISELNGTTDLDALTARLSRWWVLARHRNFTGAKLWMLSRHALRFSCRLSSVMRPSLTLTPGAR
ncbi:hypothetical protein B0H19DRAFT_1272333 [Mycena capillaripes]|nr:hypothetical protein B0H19DRAFT_1272333 [Mycena capillaripes]